MIILVRDAIEDEEYRRHAMEHYVATHDMSVPLPWLWVALLLLWLVLMLFATWKP